MAIETMRSKQFRHFGLYGRLNHEGKPITGQEAALDNCVIRQLFKRGTLTENKLRVALNIPNSEFDSFKNSIDRLLAYGLIDRSPLFRADSYEVSLTPNGKGWGLELTGQAQMDEINRAEDEERERKQAAARATLDAEPQE